MYGNRDRPKKFFEFAHIKDFSMISNTPIYICKLVQKGASTVYVYGVNRTIVIHHLYFYNNLLDSL